MRQWLISIWKWFATTLSQKKVWRIFYVLIILVSLGFIAYAIYKNWNELQRQRWEINYTYLLLSIVLYPLGMLPTVAAWHKLLEALGVRLTFVKNLRIYALSSLPRHIPGLLWYVSSRTVLYQEEGIAAGLILAATAIEVVLLALTGFLSSTLFLLHGGEIFQEYVSLKFVIPIALLIVLIMVFSTPLINKISRYLVNRWRLEQSINIQRKSLIACLAWMFIAWIGGGLLLFLLVRSVTPLGWEFYPIMVGAWGMASGIGLTIGIAISGMGLREVTLGALLSLVVHPLTAVVATVAFRLVLTVGEFLWVFLFVWLIKAVPRRFRRTE